MLPHEETPESRMVNAISQDCQNIAQQLQRIVSDSHSHDFQVIRNDMLVKVKDAVNTFVFAQFFT
jgi:ABC-type Fe2+-enterobactin transport system substrate-binding protein